MQGDERLCLACGETLKGRTDKKFCDDYCRNAHNNKQNADNNNFVRRVNNALRRNRRILETIIPAGEEMGKCPRTKLANAGFDFQYYTHQYANKKGNVYFFCYEYGYLPIEGEWVLVVRRKEITP
ncbi:hypothetical protein ACTHGU_19370 [Chitinophagaceae bacterium MMS25-I14]